MDSIFEAIVECNEQKLKAILRDIEEQHAGDDELKVRLLEFHPLYRCTPLLYAAEKGYLETLRILLGKHAAVQIRVCRKTDGFNALQIAAKV